ncbi:hypothetical protein, partial [Acinetobacter sp. CWB-B33]|uniref:hypothetical protein n=1 Tax=Acinetobacter sp. CWB-B33 TaxID=2815724 RepID=UPI0031FF41DD
IPLEQFWSLMMWVISFGEYHQQSRNTLITILYVRLLEQQKCLAALKRALKNISDTVMHVITN